MLAGVAVLGCSGGDGEFFGDDFEDGDAGSRHGRDCRLCRDSAVTCQLSPMS